MPADEVEHFGHEVALARPGQPEELAPAYVLLASDDGSFMTGSLVRGDRRQDWLRQSLPASVVPADALIAGPGVSAATRAALLEAHGAESGPWARAS